MHTAARKQNVEPLSSPPQDPPAGDGDSTTRASAVLALAIVSFAGVLVGSAGRSPIGTARAAAVDGTGTAGSPTVAPALVREEPATSEPSDSASTTTGDDASVRPEQAYGCNIADRGFGSYGPWRPLPVGRLLLPDPAPTGAYDLVLHFHGLEAARKLLAPEGLDIVLAGLGAGEGSASYEEGFHGPGVLEGVLDAVEAAVRSAGSDDGRLRDVIVTSWSAGYGAVRQILLDSPWRPDAVVLLDSLHASYDPGSGEIGPLAAESLEPFMELGRRAARSDVLVWLTHSDIRPPGYASTTETATYLLSGLGGQRRYAGLEPYAGVTQKTRYDRGGFHLWGLSGTTREAHCSQLRLLLPLVRDHVLPALEARRGN